MSRIIISLTEMLLGMVLLIGAGKGGLYLASDFLLELKKETFSTMIKFMDYSLEDYTKKLTGTKSEFAVTDEEYKKQKK